MAQDQPWANTLSPSALTPHSNKHNRNLQSSNTQIIVSSNTEQSQHTSIKERTITNFEISIGGNKKIAYNCQSLYSSDSKSPGQKTDEEYL